MANKIIKAVDPQGFLLNDNDSGVDHLDQTAYAEAIAQSIHQVQTPITIGLFARWGCGKSFLVKHILSSLKKLQKQSELDEAEIESNRRNKVRSLCSAPHCSVRWCIGVMLMLLLFTILVFALVLAIKPDVLSPDTFTTEVTPIVNATIEIVTTVSPSKQREIQATALRFTGVGVMFILVFIVLIVTCCSHLISKSYYGQVKLLAYALFTKIPISKDSNEYIIGDPGETDTNILKQADPKDRVAAASVSSSVFNRKYIFVNFRAWEFAGSDRIWAGIVTNLATAIEAEFGTVTSRLFRTTNFEALPPSCILQSQDRSKVVFVDLAAILERDNDDVLYESEVKEAMKQYGVVTRCRKRKHKSWWEIEYEQPAEARNAIDCLSIQGIRVTRDNPCPDEVTIAPRGASERESSRPLIHGAGEDVIEAVEMQPLESTPGKENVTLMPPPEPEEQEFDRQEGRFGRFCSHWSRHPTVLCCCPYLLWLVLLFVCLIVLPLLIFMTAEIFELETARTFWAVSPQAQALLWLPGSLSVVAFGVKFVWAMCNSQRSRVSRALNGTSSSMATELGFMRKVKNEVAIMTKLIHCARFVFRRDYKVVISIDDVDRVALDKVKSVLEAVNILLSDHSSPFICLIAVDSRVAVKCIEESLGEELVKANVTGYEYLKKIINLPVCLPEVGNISKRRFIAALIDESDHTTNTRKMEEEHADGKRVKKKVPRKLVAGGDTLDGEEIVQEEAVTENMDGKQFMFACREFIYNNNRLHSYLNGSPRNIKRIFNVISLSGCIIRQQMVQFHRRQLLKNMSKRTKAKDAINGGVLPGVDGDIDCNQALVEDMVHWIVLTDQWPFRASYILQIIEDADQRYEAGNVEERIDDCVSLHWIYRNKVLPELHMSQHNLLSLDNDADLLLNYLISIRDSGLTKGRARQLSAWTINLDRSLRQTIALQRELVVIENAKKQANDT